MRRITVLGLGVGLGVLTLAACQKSTKSASTGEAKPAVAAAPAAPMTPPKRKSGLWAISTNAMGRDQTIRTCVDAASEKDMTSWSQQQAGETCSQNSFKPVAGGWAFESVCNMPSGGGKITSSGTATGDFNSKYTVKVHSMMEGSSMPQANGTHDMEMNATWEGPCPAGMSPGDIMMPNGMKIGADMMKGARGR